MARLNDMGRKESGCLVPVVEPLTMETVWEHTPLDYYRYGEYPRFIRPVGAHRPRTRQTWGKKDKS